MNIILIFLCLFCAAFANPIINIDLDSPALDRNMTDTLLVAQSSGNNTSSSESESSESTESASSHSTSEESDSVESHENTEMLVETSDDSMGSEENVRKSWVRLFATVVRDDSAEDNSTEVKDQQPEKLAEKQPMMAPTAKTLKKSGDPKVSLLQKVQAVSESSSESSESTDHTPLILTATADSQSASSESNETSSSSSSEARDSASDSGSDSGSDSAQSSESQDSDSAEFNQIKNCVNGTQSCESEEYEFQDIGDDANYSVDLMVLDEDDRELSLRR